MRRILGSTVALSAILVLALATPAGARVTHYRAVWMRAHKIVHTHATRNMSAARAAATASRPRGARRRPHTGSALLRANPPVIGSTPAGAGSSLLSNFNGVSSLDSELTNYRQEFEPPDQGLCAGNGFVMEPVNSAYTIYKTDGSVVQGPFNVNDLFNVGGEEFTSDPRCHYDPTTGHWFVTILFLNDSFTQGKELIAVSHTSDPTGLWTEYSLTDTAQGSGCPCFGDQPRLGIDNQNIYISTDEFSILGPQFHGGQLYAFSKQELINGVAKPHVAAFHNLTMDGHLTLAIEPALTTGNAPAEYFLNSLDFAGNGDNRVGVWAMTNRSGIANGVKPTLSSVIIPAESYSSPPGAEQAGSSSLINSGDDRMQQTQFINGQVWGELDTAANIAGDSQTRSAAAWFEVNPKIVNNALHGATMTNQGYVGQANTYILYPAVQQAPNGTAVMGFSLSGPGRFPSTGYTTMPSGQTAFGPVNVSAFGQGPYDPNATRWGDYSWAVLDPSGNSVWLADEYVPPTSSQTTDRARNWGTRVFQVSTTG